MAFYFKSISDVLQVIDILDKLKIKYVLKRSHELISLDPEDRAIVVELCERFDIQYSEEVL